jgi:hypothetical protein
MLDLGNLDTILKFAIGAITLLISIATFKERFATHAKKQELKTDLEILEKIKENADLFDENIIAKVKKDLKEAYQKNNGIFEFLYGIGIFFGFGYWTYDIIVKAGGFSPWAILTLIISLVGIALLFESNGNDKEKSNGVFYRLSLINKETFRFGIVVFLLSSITFTILLFQYSNSFWANYVSGILVILGLLTIKKCIKVDYGESIGKK